MNVLAIAFRPLAAGLLFVSLASAATVLDTMWIYKSVAGQDLQLSVFLPDNYDADKRVRQS